MLDLSDFYFCVAISLLIGIAVTVVEFMFILGGV